MKNTYQFTYCLDKGQELWIVDVNGFQRGWFQQQDNGFLFFRTNSDDITFCDYSLEDCFKKYIEFCESKDSNGL